MPGRPKSQKFARIVEDQGIGRFVLYWPFGANRSGLDVEIGFVLERLRRKEVLGEDVRVLIEDDGVKRRAGGREIGPDGAFGFVSLEEGERTWYYDDLLLYRALIPFWADFDELLELLENIASDRPGPPLIVPSSRGENKAASLPTTKPQPPCAEAPAPPDPPTTPGSTRRPTKSRLCPRSTVLISICASSTKRSPTSLHTAPPVLYLERCSRRVTQWIPHRPSLSRGCADDACECPESHAANSEPADRSGRLLGRPRGRHCAGASRRGGSRHGNDRLVQSSDGNAPRGRIR